MKHFIPAFLIILSVSGAAHAKTLEEMFPGRSDLPEKERQFFQSFDFQQGPVALNAATATLNIPKDFYYLDPAATRKVLVDLWGNPPAAADGTLGMIFPARYLPADDDAWGSVVDYEADGHVSDAEANSIDYDDLLKQIQQGIAEKNGEREKQGFEPITLVGWASPPHYDQAEHALHWARELIFGKGEDVRHTLNYSVRMLGREGVLQFDFVAAMSQLDEIKDSIPTVTKLVAFDSGATYTDYRNGDKIAAYGMAGMIAAGAGAKLAAKFGLFAAIALLLKKGGFLVVLAGGAGAWKFITGLFRRNRTPRS
ncbi:DUF2167 domain-containing protein [Neorhizobium sp. NCHU2750]|uniref:DUF2167 domain-containing protein n=1 Tax=Neorhizobium sp. NCHU2750 TaxID=1825976 RepID=UPI000E758C2C|nr:hypothetical protein NCHU2750_13420 [Neorhizobium sp. NCHU2750]